MLNKWYILVAFLATIADGADHNVFKNCSRVDFCNDLRLKTPDADNTFTADLKTLNLTDGTAEIQLVNKKNLVLLLKLTALVEDKFRVSIAEEGSNRYKLADVLDGEPKTEAITNQTGSAEEGSITLATTADAKNKVTIVSSPLSVDFYKNDVLEVSIKGEKLIMELSDAAQPFAFSLKFPEAKQLYGIHEHADVLALRNTVGTASDPYRLRNLDVSGYELDSPMSLYGAIPVLYGHGTSVTSGIFLHNAAQQWYDIDNNSVNILVESASLDLFILLGPTPKDVVRQYTSLTGFAHLPQLWTLGYHQCRWNYDNESDVKNVIANFDNFDFPMDVIWLDIEYTNGKRYFTWNPDNFKDPVEMQQNISSTNRHLITIIDPHIKVDDKYDVYTGARDKNLFVKKSNGDDFTGDCWPGNSSYMDFLNPEARAYYSRWYSYDNFAGSTETLGGIWNDMNEPSVFDDSTEKTMPNDATHIGGVVHRDIHNIYGLLHTMSTHQGLLDRDNNTKRPFILSRSHFAGTQRFAAIWTGDNDASWGHLKVSYSECLNANILGIVFCGADVGGFTNNPSDELLQRWYQAAAWTPFYREHANSGTPRREPYLYSDEVQQVIRNAMKLRYKHLPVWYTLFYEHTRSGDPVIRPLFYQYPSDENVLKIDDQLLVGRDIMVRAIYEPEVKKVDVYIPGDKEIWYSINSDDVYTGAQKKSLDIDINSIPVFYRGGGIISRKDTPRRSSAEMVNDCYTIYVNLDKNGQADGTIYVDDLSSFEYRDEKNYNYVKVTYDEKNDFIEIEPIDSDTKGDYEIFICSVVINKAPDAQTKYSRKVYGQTNKASNSVKVNLNTKATLRFGSF